MKLELFINTKKVKKINKQKKKLLFTRGYTQYKIKGLDYDIKKIW